VAQKPRIIIVDDDPEDFLIIRDSLVENHIDAEFISCESGDQLFQLLSDSSDEELPVLFILDISLPVKSGFEILYDIKLDSRYRRIPLIIMSTHSNKVNIEKAYDLGANCYIKKPTIYSDMIRYSGMIKELWLAK
jgi:CheY-like chemotaxis protein